MIETLQRAGRPLAKSDIFKTVSANQPVAEDSISIYLEMREEFVKLDDGNWALSEWPETKKNVTPRRSQTAAPSATEADIARSARPGNLPISEPEAATTNGTSRPRYTSNRN